MLHKSTSFRDYMQAAEYHPAEHGNSTTFNLDDLMHTDAAVRFAWPLCATQLMVLTVV